MATDFPPPKVFCSHTSVDKPQVKAFAERLRGDGIDAWFDAWEIKDGDDIVASINQGLAEADAGLLFLSEASMASSWVNAEASSLIAAMIEDGQRLIPILLDDDAPIPELLRTRVRRGIQEYASVRDTLLGRTTKPPLGTAPDAVSTTEVTVALSQDPAGAGGLSVRCLVDGVEVATEHGVSLPTALANSYHEFVVGLAPPRGHELSAGFANLIAERLGDLGQQLEAVVFPGTVGEQVGACLQAATTGNRVDLVIETPPELAGLPFEAATFDGSVLSLSPGVQITRRVAALAPVDPAALAGPLKVLVAVGAPDEGQTSSVPLNVEREWATIVDILDDARRRGQAEVTFLESTTAADIERALAADAYHVLHLSGHGALASAEHAEPWIEMADEDGAAVPLSASALAGAVLSSGRPLPLVFLSSCRSGTASADATSMALALLQAGIPQVVAMQAAIGDDYATDLAARFYHRLTARPMPTAADGLAFARRETQRARAADASAAGRPHVSEYATAALYSRVEVTSPLLDSDGDLRQLQARPAPPNGGVVPEYGLGDVVGRRALVRAGFRALTDHPASLDEHGVVPVVAFTAMGGSGKTTIAGRIVARLRERGWPVAGIHGRLNVADIAGSLAQALPARAEALRAVTHPEVDELDAVRAIGQVLAEEQVVLVFDDFEANLVPGSGQFVSAATRVAMLHFASSARSGRLLVTSRYLPAELTPGGPVNVLEVPVGPLSVSETVRLSWRLPKLRALEVGELRDVLRSIGGHPRMLEFVDAVLRRGRSASNTAVTNRVRALAEAEGIDLQSGAVSLDEAKRVALELGLRDIMLDQLLSELEPAEREVLCQAAVNNLPVDVAFLQRCVESVAPELVPGCVERLVATSLLTPFGGPSSGWDDVVVHRWTAEGLRTISDESEHARRCRAAASARVQPDASGGVDITAAEEAVRLLVAANDEEALPLAVEVLEALDSHGLPFRLIALAAEVLAALGVATRDAVLVAQLDFNAQLRLGLSPSAVARWQQVHEFLAAQAAADPTNTEWQRDLSVSHIKLGDLATTTGDTTTATNHYQQALNIAQTLATADPTNTEWQRDLSVSHIKLGDLATTTGDTTTATNHYQQALNIAQTLATADPTNTEWQRDLSVSHNQLGDLATTTGDTTTATNHYQQALNIRQTLATADPTNTQWQRDLSVSHDRLGDLATTTGDTTTATNHYQQALNITQTLATADPTNTQWQRDLSVSHNKLGDLATTTGDTTTATNHYQQALNIRQTLATADPTNTEWQRDLSISHDRLGDLATTTGDTTTATNHYQQAINIRQTLATADPTNTQWQRDLSVSHNKLGDLATTTGDTTTATNHYQQAIALASDKGFGDVLAASLSGMAAVHRAEGDRAAAAQVALTALATRARFELPGDVIDLRVLESVKGEVGDEAFAKLLGQQLEPDAAQTIVDLVESLDPA